MAKRAARRRRKAIRKGSVHEELTLLTLANSTVFTVAPDDVAESDIYCVSADLALSLDGMTPGEGPLIVGLAHSDYNATEIEEFVENEGNMFAELDQIAIEINRRKIRVIGKFNGLAAQEILFDGRVKRIPVRMLFTEGAGLRFWAYNRSGVALTTGTVITIDGVVYWKKA